MTSLPLAPVGDAPCAACRGSADGCSARQAARAGLCCRRCTHPDADLDDANLVRIGGVTRPLAGTETATRRISDPATPNIRPRRHQWRVKRPERHSGALCRPAMS